MTAGETAAAPAAGPAQRTVRRLVVYTILFALVTIAAVGLGGLLARLLDPAAALAGGGTTELARSLAFALIGGPAAAILWWVLWRRLADGAERTSLGWGLYVVVMYVVSLVVATTALVGTATALIGGRWLPGDLSVGVVWALVWLWHRWMSRHPAKRPTRLATVPAVVGAVFGLVIGAGGAITALGSVFDTAISGAREPPLAGSAWWQVPLQGLAWAVAGGAIWWWHWIHDGASRLRTGLAAVALVVVGVLGFGVVMLAGLGTALFVGLRLAFDPGDPVSDIVRPLGTAIAAAAVGAVVWRSHHRIAVERSDGTRRASALVMSAVGLAAAASGVGVIVNALLAALVGPLAASETRTLLLGGISALAVGGPVWWLDWRPNRRVEPVEIAHTGRRVYLIAVFGISAVIAIITLLVIGFRLFEFVLDPTTTAALVDRLRAPLGLLVATALVFGYHFAVWRHDRTVIAAAGLVSARRIARVILVVAEGGEELAKAVESATGASVSVWHRAAQEPARQQGGESGTAAGAVPGAVPGAGPDAAAVAAALEGVSGKRVLVLAGPGERVEVVRLAD